VSTVKLELEGRSESLVVVRGMLVGVADLLGFDGELLQNLKTVVSEACNNVVLHAYGGEPGPLSVGLEVGPDRVEAVVRDWGGGIHQVVPSEDRMHVGMAVISTLADRVQFLHADGGGTEVRMAFASPHGIGELEGPNGTASLDGAEAAVELSGDATATLSPVGLLAGVLARVATALAARAHFSLDRFCDVYLITDAVAAHAEPSAAGARVGFAVAAEDHRLELTVGPFRTGSAVELREDEGPGRLGSALALLSVDLAVEPRDGVEMWHLTVLDGDGASAVPGAV
jgi:serine/threonine-protein kinase RsbW